MDNIASLLEGKRKVILVHGNADMDAIGSAYALAELFPPAEVFAPNGMDRIAKIASEKAGMIALEECDISSYELAVVVDTSAPEQLETDQTIPSDAVVIDHHRDTGGWEGHPMFRDETRVSCCEIILDFYLRAGKKPSKEAAMMLLGGMITDSGGFQFADPRTLRAFAALMEGSGIQMDEALEFTRAPVSISERVAMLKAMERVKFDRVGTLVVATTVAGSFESSVCRALLGAGADIAFAGSQRDDEFRLSGRATQDAVRKGIDLGSIMCSAGVETESTGGGHAGAAGISGIGDVEAMLHICSLKSMEVMREIKAREMAAEEERP
ncbi:MAG: DHH family phosphoesterase [Candidatus Methanomethylophilaceae archaeon]|nr:DHH family phosphoesterase [Candidatus Methanomethylophilaceae archaeon]